MNFKKFAAFFLAALLGGVVTFGLYRAFESDHRPLVSTTAPPSLPVGLTEEGSTTPNFIQAANHALPAVVHIRSSMVVERRQAPMDIPAPFRDFFGIPRGQEGPQNQLQQGSGSGVIISDNGYIVTNYHVVQEATEILVTLHDNRQFEAEVIGSDPSTDLALIRVDEKDLQFLQFSNSDDVQVGEWVLAVGNPFNLASTVTAGIISAKGRNINILRDRQAPIESFIQTDAAVNPGNSGGALVNTRGELIGINTAIATPTGTYAGYSFAVPSNIVQKVINDLEEYGVVQRAYLGVFIRDLNQELAKEVDVDLTEGVLVDSLISESAAEASGIEKGDVIVQVDEAAVKRTADLLEQIGRHRPGEKVAVKVVRDGRETTIDVVLKNRAGNTEVVASNKEQVLNLLGAQFEELTGEEADKLSLPGGLKVVDLGRGKLSTQTDIRKGFVITGVDKRPVRTLKDLEEALADQEGGVLIEGVYPGVPGKRYYAFGM
jgi:serine protease Do